MSAQQQLPLDLALARPLWHLGTVMDILDKGEDDVVAMVEDGRLPVAFNLARQSAERRLIAVWRTCVWELRDKGGSDSRETAVVLDEVLPARRTELRGTEVKRILSGNQGHFANLLADGELRRDRARCAGLPARGPGSSPWILTVSVREFLTRRRI